MNEGKTTMKGWGNAVIISPVSNKFAYNSMSYDLFSTAHAALAPAFSQDFEVFQENAAQHFLGKVEAKGKLPITIRN